jgi:endoplasmic reticulum-Golgi intermediate compartment protein 3
MPAKSRFTKLDAFTKTVEDARIRTTSGGLVTIASLLVVIYLIWGEWSDYRRVLVQPELIVDKGRGMKPSIIIFDVKFPFSAAFCAESPRRQVRRWRST